MKMNPTAPMRERVAIIGGTGIDGLPGMDLHLQVVQTPYGEVTVYVVEKQPFPIVYLNRHGPNRKNPPHAINYLGNMKALQLLGVRRIFATNAVGSINRRMPPLSLVVLSDFINFTSGRPLSYYNGGDSGHAYLEMNQPYCQALRKRLLEQANLAGLDLIDGGVYGATNGPRFETPAEIRMYERLGVDLVGMTGVPESHLARELGMHYAAVAYSINWAAGLEENIQIVTQGVDRLLDRLLRLFVDVLEVESSLTCACEAALMMVRPPQEN
jgi:5'-methylthioadenosine phosphorylase